MRQFKRDNWTNEEVIKFLRGVKLTSVDLKELPQWVKDHNDGVDSCIDLFNDFQVPVDDYSAMGYCVEEDEIFHIGPLLPRVSVEE